MIKFVSEPGIITFSNNPIVYRLQATGIDGEPFRAKGARSILTTTATEFEIDGWISLVVQEADGTPIETIAFAKANPQGDGQFSYMADWQAIANLFIKNRLVAPSIKVSYSEDNGVKILTAEARNVEPNWTLYWNYDGILNGTTEILNYDYTTMNAPTGYQIGYEVFFEKTYLSDVWESVFEGFCMARDSGDDVFLNFSSILSNECTASLRENPFAQYSRTQPVLADNLRRYYIRFKESATNIRPVWTVKPVQTVLIGGLPTHEWLAYGGIIATNAIRSLLTYQPVRYIPRSGVEWLSWYNYTGSSVTVKVFVQTIYNNGITDTMTKYEIIVPNYRTATFPVSAAALQLPENVKAYNIRIIDAAESPLSTWRGYVIEDDYPASMRLLAYLNAFNVPEVAVCAGDFTRKVSIADRRAQSVRGSESAGQITRTERSITDYNIQYTYRSGYINTKQKEAYTELRLSPVLFDVTTTNYLALVLKAEQTNNADTIGDTGEKLYTSEWSCEPRVALQNFGLDSFLRAASTLSEPIFRIGNGTPVDNPDDVIGVDTPIDTPDYDIPTMDWEDLGLIQDTDLLLFAKTDETGKLVGFRKVESGKYMRHVRGLPLDADSHLEGVGFKEGDTNNVTTLKTDKNGSNYWE